MKQNRKKLLTLPILLLSFLFIACNPTGAVNEDPVINSYFSAMEDLSYTGSDPATIDDISNSLEYIAESLELTLFELYDNSTDQDLTDIEGLFDYIFNYTSFTKTAAVNVDTATLSGDLNIGIDESYGNATFAGDLTASITHSDLLVISEGFESDDDGDDDDDDNGDGIADYLNIESDMDATNGIVDGSFNISMELSDLDFLATDITCESYDDDGNLFDNGTTIEYFRIMTDMELSFEGTEIDLPNETDTGAIDPDDGDPIYEQIFTDGDLNLDIDLDLKMGLVMSSTDSNIDGCKMIITLELTDSISDFDLTGLDAEDFDSTINGIIDFISELSSPVFTIDVFDSDNNYLFTETMDITTEIDDLLDFDSANTETITIQT